MRITIDMIQHRIDSVGFKNTMDKLSDEGCILVIETTLSQGNPYALRSQHIVFPGSYLANRDIASTYSVPDDHDEDLSVD